VDISEESSISFLLQGGRLRPGVSPDSVRIYQTTRLHFPTDFTVQEQKIYGLSKGWRESVEDTGDGEIVYVV